MPLQLVVIIAVALVLLYGLLKDYEAGRPANTMDKLVSHIEAGNVGKWIKDGRYPWRVRDRRYCIRLF